MNIVDEPGIYRNFSGIIKHSYRIDCEVKNATFELLDKMKKYKNRVDIILEFESGNVIAGKLCNANIKHCNFQGYMLAESVFHNGVFSGEMFSDSYWLGGTWNGANWMQGFDRFGRIRVNPPTMWDNKVAQTNGVANEPGRYENFTGRIKCGASDLTVKDASFELINPELHHKGVIAFHSGIVLGGQAKNIVVNHCIWKNGAWMGGYSFNSTWYDGIWEDGDWHGSYWYGGDFNGGTWFGGRFAGGTFNGGTWMDGFWSGDKWLGGYDKYGDWHDKNDIPNRWRL